MKRYLILLLLIMTALLAIPVFGLGAHDTPPAEPTPEAAGELVLTDLSAPPVPPRRADLPVNVNPTLLHLSARVHAADAALADFVDRYDLQLQNGRVLVQVTYNDQAAAETAVRAAGGQISGHSAYEPRLLAWLPPSAVPGLAHEQNIDYIGLPYTAVPVDITAGDVETEGLLAANVDAWHDAGYYGDKIKIAIVDVGFIGYQDRLGSELPPTVTVKNFVDADGENPDLIDTDSPHGTAVAEIVHDIAPGAQLYFIKINTDVDLDQAVSFALSQDIDIISTSLIWYNATPGDGSGVFASIVARARAGGILWLTAAGNDRERHWGGSFFDPDGDSCHNFTQTQEVNYFGPGDGSPTLIQPGHTIRLYLRWNAWSPADQDLNLFLVRYNDSGASPVWEAVAASQTSQIGFPGQRPVEALAYTTSGDSVPYGIVICAESISRPVDFDIFASRQPRLDELVTARSLGNLADVAQALTVSGVDWRPPYAQLYYSAEGPTNGAGGSWSDTGVIDKPQIAAYTGVLNDTYGRFGGTSASTPHVSGAAALVKQAFPSFTTAQLQDYLQNSSLDLGPSGYDTRFGFGRLYLPDFGPTPTPTATATPTTTPTPSPTPTLAPTSTPAAPEPYGAYLSAIISYP